MDKEELIYIEADEEITSVVDRLHKTPSREIVLVVPRGALVLQSLVNLKLLKREAGNAKKSIGLVSVDVVGRSLAAQAGITILESAQSKRVLIEPKSPPPQELPQEVDLTLKEKPPVKVHHFQEKPIGAPIKTPEPATFESKAKSKKPFIVTLIILIVIVALAIVFVPSAQIGLIVAGETYERDLDIEVTTGVKVPSIELSQVPGEFVEVEAQANDKFNSAGKKNVGDKAKGTATLTNDAGVDQILQNGAKLSGAGLTFVTTQEVNVPKATLNAAGDKLPGKTTVQVEAAEAGDRSNVSNLAVGVPKDKLSGKIDSTSGGLTREVSVVSAEDIAAAKSTLQKKAQDEIKNQIAKKSNRLVMDGAVKFETIEAKESVAEGTEANEFEMKLKEKGKALVFAEAVYRETYITILRQGLPPQKDLVFSSADEIVTQVADADFTSGAMTVKGTIKTQLVPQFNLGLLKKDLVAKSPDQAKEIAKRLEQVNQIEITTKPAWWVKRLPLVAARIKVKVEHK